MLLLIYTLILDKAMVVTTASARWDHMTTPFQTRFEIKVRKIIATMPLTFISIYRICTKHCTEHYSLTVILAIVIINIVGHKSNNFHFQTNSITFRKAGTDLICIIVPRLLGYKRCSISVVFSSTHSNVLQSVVQWVFAKNTSRRFQSSSKYNIRRNLTDDSRRLENERKHFTRR